MHLLYIAAVAYAAFTDYYTVPWNKGAELECCRNIHGKGLQVTVIDADDFSPALNNPLQFSAVMNLDQALHAELAAQGKQGLPVFIAKDGCDEEDGISTKGSGFVDLIDIEKEVLT